jgi:hypothetical protein
VFLADDSDALGPAAIDVVLGQQPLELVDLRREPIEELLDLRMEPARQVLAQAADADVAREEAEAGNQLVDVEQQLTLADRIEQHRDGADFQAVRADPDQMTGDPLELRDEHADVLDALRHLEPEQLFDGERVGQAVALRAQVIHALDERDDLLPLLLLGGLFDPGVQVADGRNHRLDDFSIELEHEPQHTVGAGVLGPHVDRHRFSADV